MSNGGIGACTALVLRVLFVFAVLAIYPATGAASVVTPLPAVTPAGLSQQTVNAGPGDQSDPHISGDVVSYTSALTTGSEIRYFNLATATDAAIPNFGAADLLSWIDGNTIVYTHQISGCSTIMSFDIATGGPPSVLGPGPECPSAAPSTYREAAAIGGNTIAWLELGPTGASAPQVAVYDRTTGTTTSLAGGHDARDPSVSPDGSVVAWTECMVGSGASATGCEIRAATRDASGSWTNRLLTTEGENSLPTTNGTDVFYGSYRGGQQDIYWQPVGGGTESQLDFPGISQNPTVSGRVLTFEHEDTTATFPEFDIYAYDTVSHALYQITKTPYDEILEGVSFDPATYTVHVTWTALQADENVYAATFKLIQPDVTNIESSPNPSTYGEPVTLTAWVTPGTVFSPNLNATPPTGTIRFSIGYIYEPGTTIGTATLVPNGLTGASTATLQTSSLPVGDENIVATYSGDANYEASATEGTHQLVHQAPTKTTLASSANPAQAGKSVTFTAIVTPGTTGGVPPTGSVAFTDNGSPIPSCSPAPLSGGAASCTVSYPATGGHNIVATYGGDGNYLGSTSATLTQLATLWLCPTLVGCNLHGLNLTGANFAGDNLSGANLQSTNLTHANLAGANLSSANLNLANLTGADLAGANLSGANLNGAIWSNTTCPDGTNSNADGGTCTGHL